jgi:hypothetical protein
MPGLPRIANTSKHKETQANTSPINNGDVCDFQGNGNRLSISITGIAD